MITYNIWETLLYIPGLHIITFWSMFLCLCLSLITIPLDILLCPIEILSGIILGIIKLVKKIKEKE